MFSRYPASGGAHRRAWAARLRPTAGLVGVAALAAAAVLLALCRDGGPALPRAALALTVGACMGLATAALQGLTATRAFDPALLGLVTMGQLAALLPGAVGLAWLTSARHPAMAPLCAAAGIGLALRLLLGRRFRRHTSTLLTAGAALHGAALVAALGLVQGGVAGHLPALMWGQLSQPPLVPLASLWRQAAAGALCLWLLAPQLNAAQLGPVAAGHLGVDARRLALLISAAAALVLGAAACAAGPVAFVGLLAVPLARRLVGANASLSLPAAGLVGGALVVLVDLLGRHLLAAEIPAGLFTTALGAPVFMLALARPAAID